MSEIPKQHAESVADLTDKFRMALNGHFPSGQVNINEVCSACITIIVAHVIQIQDRRARQEFVAKLVGIIVHLVAKESN